MCRFAFIKSGETTKDDVIMTAVAAAITVVGKSNQQWCRQIVTHGGGGDNRRMGERIEAIKIINKEKNVDTVTNAGNYLAHPNL